MSSHGPAMLMYWHGGINDYMLFKEWVPQSVGSYAGAWILFFALTVLLEGLMTFRHNTELEWNKQAVSAHNQVLTSELSITAPLTGSSGVKALPWWQRAILEALFQFLESGLAYLVMLVTMIFNIGLFFSIVLGHAVGVFLFYRLRENPKGAKNTGSPNLNNPNLPGTPGTLESAEERPTPSCH